MDSTGFMVENFQEDSWIRLDLNKHVDWFTNEFRWVNQSIGKQAVKRIIKNYLDNISEFCQTLSMTNQLKSMVEGKRYVLTDKNIVLDYKERVAADIQPGDTIYFNESNTSIISPGLVIEQRDNGNCRIIYFTNLSRNLVETNSTDINGWAFASVSPKEIGTTPIMARQNSYS